MQQGSLFDTPPPSNSEKSVGQLRVYHHHSTRQLKQHLIQHLLDQNPSKQEKTYVLVHSNLLANHLKHHLNQHALPSYPLHFITFFDLAKIVLSTLNLKIDKPVLDKNLCLLKLNELCHTFFQEDVPNASLKFLDHKPAFINNLLTSYAYLDKQSISYWPNQHEDLLAMYKKYQKEFAAHYYTQDSFLKDVSLHIGKNSACSMPHNILVYGFYDFSPVQVQLLSNIHFSKKLLWVLDDSPALESFSHLPTQAIHDQVNTATKKPAPVYSCLHENHELDTLKNFLLEQLNQNPKQLNTSAVLLPNQHYLNLCKDLFKQHRIPHYSPIPDPVRSSNLGKVLTLLLNYYQSSKEQKDIIKFILDFPGKEAQLNKKDVLFLLHKHRIFNQALLMQSTQPEFTYIKQCLHNLTKLFEKPLSYDQFFKQLTDFFTEYIDKDCLAEQLEHALLFDLQKHFQTLQKIKLMFTQASLLFSLEQFLLLKRSDNSCKKMHESGVYLAPIDYAAFFNFDHVYILGLNQNAFPKSDQLLNLLNIEKPSLDHPPVIHHRQKDIALLKQLFASTANLHLFYSQHDQLKDQSLQKSLVFDYIETQPAQMPSDATYFSSMIDYQKKILTPRLRSMSSDQVKTFSQKAQLMDQQMAWMQSHLNPKPTFDASSGQVKLPDIHLDTFSVTALQRYATCPYQYFLNDILKLHSDAWPEDIYGLHPMEKGELLHKVLFLFYQRCLNQGKASLKQKNVWLKEIFEQLSTQQKKQNLKKPQLWPLEQLNLYQRIKNFISYEHLNHKDFHPLALEMRFGQFKSSYEDQHYSRDEALCLKHQGQIIYFRGKIDRIDMHVDQQQLHVIDYKSGKVAAKNNDFAQGKTIQMAIYLLVCQKYFEHIPLKNMHARMVSVDPKQNFNEKYLSGAYLEENLDDFYTLIFSLRQHIGQGVFFQQPGSNAQHCQRCDYRMICQSSIQKRAQLLQKNPELIKILEKHA